ncbi:MAG: prolipoprotein diacylglyceryl transferase [Alphaproteobacteria bacterium]|nr:prolipoprotein diacylglyceryl transferase [Alphaproteobacteria bacterium]
MSATSIALGYSGIQFPNIDPVAIHLGQFGIRWYSLAYLFGILFCWFLTKALVRRYPSKVDVDDLDDAFFWMTLGVILGGRIGYVLFYNFQYYLDNPSQILAVWRGGMSFHGGILGVIIAIFFYTRSIRVSFFDLSDLCACVAPLGLFFGRLANFVNGELFGRITTSVPWAMIFPAGGPLPRHPSQLYEAMFEGLFLFILLYTSWTKCVWIRVRTGFVSGMFLSGYAIARFLLENYREPDPQLGFMFARITMGQCLTLPMLIIGLLIMFITSRRV